MKKEHENFANEEYMKKWVAVVETEANKRKELEEKHKKQVLDVKDYQLMQMGDVPLTKGGSIVSM